MSDSSGSLECAEKPSCDADMPCPATARCFVSSSGSGFKFGIRLSFMHALVLTTTPDAESARSICERLLELRLAACANSFPVGSAYRWKGDIENTDEVMIAFKARGEDFDEIRAEIERLHPYETPCIELIQIGDCNRSCSDWVKDSTERHRANSVRR